VHRHYSYYWRRCRDCGAIASDCSEYCEACEPSDLEEVTVEEQEDSIPPEATCSCTWPYVPSNALYPPEPVLNRYCPIHGDGGPDPDAALEAQRDRARDNGD